MMPRPRRGPLVVASKRRRIDGMCMGGGKVKTAEQFYNEMKVAPEPLPSLTFDSAARKKPTYGQVRTGIQRRSLLQPGMMTDAEQ